MSRFSDRRILTFPTTSHFVASSPIAIIDALLAIAEEMTTLHLSCFIVHRRSICELLREIGVIREFLKDVRDRGGVLPSCTVVGFSELLVGLQKVRFLIDDCHRLGAQLWLLASVDRVSFEFRVLVRSIASALDVLPLGAIDASNEMKDLLRLVRDQGYKVAIEPDLADVEALRDLWSVLDQFKNGIPPPTSNLRRVLDHLQIKSWTDCSEVLSFLEEIFFATVDGENDEENDAVLASSLMGFIIYCRAVLFDYANDNKLKQKDCAFLAKMNTIELNADTLRCPISLEIMMNPVTVSTGQTYDKGSIIKWFKSGGLTCPVTGEKLKSSQLIPNLTVRSLVEQFCREKKIPFAEPSIKKKHDFSKTTTPLSCVASGAVRVTAAFLVDNLAYGNNQDKNKAAYEIRKLSKSNIFNRFCLVEAGAVPWLLHLFGSFDPSIQENAVAALLNLSKHSSGRKPIVEAGGMSLIIDIIKYGAKVEAKQNAAAILFYLSSVEEYRVEMGAIPEAIPTLIELLKEGTYRGKKNAVVTIFGLLMHSDNCQKVLSFGSVEALTSLLSSENDDLINDSIAVLAKIAEKQEGSRAILCSSAVPKLIEFLRLTESRSGKECCVSLLLSLCKNGGAKVITNVEQMPLLMTSLYSLVTDGSPQASKKARLLLNHIHCSHEQEYGAVLAPSVQDHLVRAQ